LTLAAICLTIKTGDPAHRNPYVISRLKHLAGLAQAKAKTARTQIIA
jgi:hypothetical protein